MNFRLFFLLTLAFTTLSHCGLVEDALPDIDFKVTADQLRFAVPSTDGPTTIEITQENVASEIVAELDREDIDADRIKSLKVDALELELMGDTSEFGFADLESATVTVSAPGRPAVTLGEGALRDVNGALATLNLGDTDLKDQLLADQATYTVSLRTSSAVPEGVVLGVTPRFAVVARPL